MPRFLLLFPLLLLTACATPLQSLHGAILAVPWQEAEYKPTPREDCGEAFLLLTTRATALNITVTFGVFDEEGKVGEFNRATKAIVISRGMPNCGNLETLAHELGHVLAPPLLFGTLEGQVFADGVSYLTVRVLGHYDPQNVYAHYLAGMKVAAPTLLTYQKDIENAAKWLIAGGKRLDPLPIPELH